MAESCTHPELRAVVDAQGRVFACYWNPGLANSWRAGVTHHEEDAAATSLFDLRFDRVVNDDGNRVVTDLEVITVREGANIQQAVESLIDLAGCFRVDRVWVGAEVVVPTPRLLGGKWQVTCERCDEVASEDSYQFWLTARSAGYFPPYCGVCGQSLQQTNQAHDDGPHIADVGDVNTENTEVAAAPK